MYAHQQTQKGYFLAAALAAGLLFSVSQLVHEGFRPPLAAVTLLLGTCLVTFSTLGVAVGEKTVKIVFGPGLIRKTIRLDDIEACRVVRVPWYHGWGIRIIPGGWLFRVAGSRALEIKTRNGRIYQVGAAAPAALEEALKRQLRQKGQNDG